MTIIVAGRTYVVSPHLSRIELRDFIKRVRDGE
jgi:hypothetical protein